MEEPLTAKDIWSRLSVNGIKLAVILSLPGGSKSPWYLERMSDEMEVDLEAGLDQLKNLGVLVQSSLIQEKRERLEELGGEIPPDEFTMTRQEEVTDSFRDRLRLQSDIQAYEQEPGCHLSWEQPRYGLMPEFQGYIELLHAAADQ